MLSRKCLAAQQVLMEIRSGKQTHKRVLIVEDYHLNLKLFVDLVTQLGYETLCAKDGCEALKVAQDELPDLILMDDQLPDMSGVEVVRRLRDDEPTRSIPIIAVFEALNGWERAALDAGCDAYVSKPISASHFLEMIDSFLSKGDHQDDGIAGRAAFADKRYEGRIMEDRPEPIG